MKPVMVDKDGNKLMDLWRDASGGPMLPRKGEIVKLADGSKFMVADVQWDFELEEIQVFVKPKYEPFGGI